MKGKIPFHVRKRLPRTPFFDGAAHSGPDKSLAGGHDHHDEDADGDIPRIRQAVRARRTDGGGVPLSRGGDGAVRVYKRIEFCAAGESLLLFLPAYTLFVYGIIVDLHLQKMVDICA